MGLVGVLGTQLWHHTFLDGSLADLPSWPVRKMGDVHARGNGRPHDGHQAGNGAPNGVLGEKRSQPV